MWLFDIFGQDKKEPVTVDPAQSSLPIYDEDGKQIGEYERSEVVATADGLMRVTESQMEYAAKELSKLAQAGTIPLDYPPHSTVNIRTCKYCGCTDTNACRGGCYWISEDVDVCSNPKCMKKYKKERQKPLSCHEKILTWMSGGSKWKISHFQKEPFFIGYKANSRINELMKLGQVRRVEDDGRFAQYQITELGEERVKTFILNNTK